MITITETDATITKVTITDSGGGDSPTAKIRVVLELPIVTEQYTDNAALDALPLSDEIRGLIAHSVGDDGASTTLAIKREHEVYSYKFDGDSEHISLLAEVVLRPQVKVVEGSASLRWTIEAVVPADTVRTLACLVGRDVRLTTSATQLSLVEEVA